MGGHRSVLVTGIAGFIGTHVARRFLDAGCSVTGVDTVLPLVPLKESLAGFLHALLPSPDLASFVQRACPDVCVYCAGPSSVGASVADPGADFASSVPGVFSVLDALRLHAPECRFVFLSSAAVYGSPDYLPIPETQSLNPVSPYGHHKVICEEICTEMSRLHRIPTRILRIFSAYGRGLRRQVVWDICRKASSGPILRLNGTGSESRDFIHITDIVEAIYFLSHIDHVGAEVYNVASGKEITIRSLAELVLAALGFSRTIEFDGVVGQGIPSNWRADISRLRNAGFTPIMPLERGVRDFVEWFEKEAG